MRSATIFREVNCKLASRQILLDSINEAGITASVVNTPPEFIRSGDADTDIATVQRVNDEVAELVSAHPDRLYGLAP